MSLIDTLIAKIAPHDCLACGAEGHLLCAACADRLPPAAARCYRCRQTSLNSLTCTNCRPPSQLHRLPVATIYDSHAKALIWQLKLAGTRAAVRIMAARMAPLVKADTTNLLIVPVPTATSRARQRGYDQAKLLARELAWQARLPYRDCLARHGQTHQHGLSRQERLGQLSAAFRVKRPESIKGANILLVDDVVTTGATLEAAANSLQAAGATRIEAVVFARPAVRSIKF
jgi:ComF family protein